MSFLAGYSITETIRSNDEFALYRAIDDNDKTSVLILGTISDKPAAASISMLEHEFQIRSELPAAGVAQPLLLEKSGTQVYLIIKDTGGFIAEKYLQSTADSSIEKFLKLSVNIAEALGHIHAEGFIHGDIRPGNILVQPEDYDVKIMGFGVATKDTGVVASLESLHIPLEYMAYLSPEKTGRMNRAVDTRSDLYSLGVSLYQMLTRKLPFEADNVMEWVHCHVARPPASLTEHNSEIPSMLENIILKLLHKNAEDRYQTAQGLAFDLKRCLNDWKQNQSIDYFELGLNDKTGKLSIKDKVYGRKSEKNKISQIADKSLAGDHEVLILKGPSGMGKTTLAVEVLSQIDTSAANIISVKFESSENNVPYNFIIHTVKEFVRQVLFKSENIVSFWKDRILKSLEENAKVAIDIAPDLELLIGSQPDVIPLPTNEAKKRFQSTLVKLYVCLCDSKNPLLLFLDDFDAIDSASLEFLSLLSAAKLHNFLIIYAFKTDHLDETSEVLQFLESIKDFNNLNYTTIELGPLNSDDICELTADSLGEQLEDIQEFAHAVFDKTGGSPFFTVQFLEDCIAEKLLSFDLKAGRWNWDLQAINAKTFSDNVVEVLLNKIEKLPEKTKYILEVFSCAGAAIHEELLGTLCHMQPEDLAMDLMDALQAGFLTYNDGEYLFTHERIKNSAYHMMNEDEQNQIHLKIARFYRETFSKQELQSSVFAVAMQWNKVSHLVTDEEKGFMRQVNKIAGTRAKAQTAYQSARDYFFLVSLLSDHNTWMQDYDITLYSYLELLECEFLLGQHEKADDWSKIILQFAKNEIDKSRVYEMRMRVYQLTGKLEDAINAGLKGLALFGYEFPESEDELKLLVDDEQTKIDAFMKNRTVESLVDLPVCSDQKVETIISLMTDLGPCLAIVRPKSFLYVLQVYKSVCLAMYHGFTLKSCLFVHDYARRLFTHGKDIEKGRSFAQIAFDIYEKFNDNKFRGRMKFFDAVYLNHWQYPISRSFTRFEHAFAECVAIGNFGFASFSGFFLLTHIMDQGQQIEKVYEASVPFIEFAKKIHNPVLYEAILLYQQLVSRLQLEPSETMYEGCADMPEEERLQWLKNAKFAPGIGGYMIQKQKIALLFRQYPEAVGIGKVVGQSVAPGGLASASYFFVQALALINLQRYANEKPHSDINSLKNELAPFINELKYMAECTPVNFLDRYELVQAELAALEGRHIEAQAHYERAIQQAHDNGFSINEALSYELAAEHYLLIGKKTIAYAYFYKAMDCYSHIGATAKSKQLSKLHAGIKEMFGGKNSSTTGNLDVMSIISASQAMSSEIVLDEVIKYLMTIVLENAGAVRGLLILPFADGFKIVAEAKTGKQISVDLQHSDVDANALPETIYQYVIRSRKNMLLDNACDSKDYSSDPYIQKQRAKSILFLPLIKQGNMTGILYLENNLSTGAFTADRMAVLEMLISQASISIENARLYKQQQEAEAEIRRHRDHLEELVAERTVEIKQKTNDIESMLKNMDLGICTIVPGNLIHHEYSPYLEVIFNENELAGKNVMTSLFNKTTLGSDSLDQINVALDAIINEDAMMYDFNSHLLVDEIIIMAGELERTIQVDWSPIVNEDDIIDKMLFISKDVTHLKELEADFALQRQSLMLISQIIKVNASKFDSFIDASLEYIEKNRTIILEAQQAGQQSGDIMTSLFRNMHTIKGNSRTYNFALITEAAHQAEQYYDHLRHEASEQWNYEQMLSELMAVSDAVVRYQNVNAEDLGRGTKKDSEYTGDGVVVSHELLSQLKSLLSSDDVKSMPEFSKMKSKLNALDLVPIDVMVSEVAQSLASTAQSVGKPVPKVVFTSTDYGFKPAIKSKFQDSLMHLLRNCLDHGIELPEERESKGKSPQGTITFIPSMSSQGQCSITFFDDGRGLALHRLYQKGVEAGIFSALDPLPDYQEIAEVIFNSGLSTAESVTEVSGRGVGMDAVREFLKDLGAQISVIFPDPKRVTTASQLSFAPIQFLIQFNSDNMTRI